MIVLLWTCARKWGKSKNRNETRFINVFMNSLLWGPYLSSTYIGLPPLFSEKCLALDVRSLYSKLKTYLLPLRMDGVARYRVGRCEDRLERCGSPSRISEKPSGLSDTPPHHTPGMPDRVGLKRFADRFLRKGKRKIGICESLYNIATSSCTCHFHKAEGPSSDCRCSLTLGLKIVLNLCVIFIPVSWVLYFKEGDHYPLIFACKLLQPFSQDDSLKGWIKFPS